MFGCVYLIRNKLKVAYCKDQQGKDFLSDYTSFALS